MENLTVQWVELATTKNGKPYKKVTVDNKTFSVWSDDPQYEAATPGGTLTGSIVQDGKYWKFVGHVEGHDPKPQRAYSGGKGNIAAAQERKAEDIAYAQSNKEHSIRVSSTFRDATLIATQELAHYTGSPELYAEEFKARWLHWRNWLSQQYNDPLI